MTLDSQPKRLSPIHDRHQDLNARFTLQAGWQIPEIYTTPTEETAALRDHVGLADISALGKLTIKGSKADGIIATYFGESPTKPGDVIAVKSSQLLVAKLTIGEYLILTSPGVEQETAISLEAEIATQNTYVSVIDQTSGLVGLLISGPKSSGVMRKLCALDFDPIDFPNLHVAQSSFAKVRAAIIRHDQKDVPTFELYTDRSYANYLWNTILDAGMEFGIKPIGWEATKILRSQI